MSEERIGDKFLRKLYEKTVNNGIDSIDRDEIGKEIGIIDAFLPVTCGYIAISNFIVEQKSFNAK